MRNPDAIIVKQLTYDECLNKDKLVLIKYIIARMAELDPFPENCSLPLKNDVYDRIEEKLLHSYQYELIDILESENELRMICNDMLKEKLKEIMNSFNDDGIESENESMYDVSDLSESEDEISELNSSNYVEMIERLTRGKKSHIRIKFA